MFSIDSCPNVFGGYEDPVDEIIACRTGTWTLTAALCFCGVWLVR